MDCSKAEAGRCHEKRGTQQRGTPSDRCAENPRASVNGAEPGSFAVAIAPTANASRLRQEVAAFDALPWSQTTRSPGLAAVAFDLAKKRVRNAGARSASLSHRRPMNLCRTPYNFGGRLALMVWWSVAASETLSGSPSSMPSS